MCFVYIFKRTVGEVPFAVFIKFLDVVCTDEEVITAEDEREIWEIFKLGENGQLF